MSVVAMPHLLVDVVFALLPLLVIYWVIRLAVRHGIRDSRRNR
jgi:hypothetical protein